MTAIEGEKRSRSLSLSTRLRPVAFVVALLVLWQIAVSRHPDQLLPGPWAVVKAIGELLQHGLLLKYVVASLFRVTWGFALAAVLAIPLGLALVGTGEAKWPFNPLVQIFRPISPLAWIPLAILWFGVGDFAAIFLIFLGCFFPLLLTAMSAVRNIPAVYINVGRNFGLSTAEFVSRVFTRP